MKETITKDTAYWFAELATKRAAKVIARLESLTKEQDNIIKEMQANPYDKRNRDMFNVIQANMEFELANLHDLLKEINHYSAIAGSEIHF